MERCINDAQCRLMADSGLTNHTLKTSAFNRNGEEDMTKAKARLRAKAKAAQKTKSEKPTPNKPAQKSGWGNSIRDQVR